MHALCPGNWSISAVCSVFINTCLLQTESPSALFVGQVTSDFGFPKPPTYHWYMREPKLMLLGSGFVWGEHPQNYLMCILVLVSDHIDFYINYRLEACAYRSHIDEK